MTPFDAWVHTTAAALVGSVREDHDFDLLEKRIAIGLVQARAAECRQVGTSVFIHHADTGPLARVIYDGLSDRSHNLEQLGLKMAAPEPEPVVDEKVVEMPEAPGPRLVR